MLNPNLEHYKEIKRRNVSSSPDEKNGKFEWYLASQDLFREEEEISKDSIIRKMAYAYSWMPTIPKWCQKDDHYWEELIYLLNNFKSTPNQENLKAVLDKLVPIVNNSITGTSKVLNFMFPEICPVIDSRVVKSWKAFFKEGTISGKDKISGFVNYFNLMHIWKCNCKEENASINDLERELFIFNGGKYVETRIH